MSTKTLPPKSFYGARAVVNRELHADLDLDAFAHAASWNGWYGVSLLAPAGEAE